MKCIMHVLVLLFVTIPSFARLAPTTLDSLIKESEIIVEVRLVKSKGLNSQLRVVKTFKGQIENDEIKITHSSEIHDQNISSSIKEWLLFLKKTSSGYDAAQYGRSYWPIAQVSGEKVFMYEYPISILGLTEPDRTTFFGKNSTATPSDKKSFIPMKALLQKIADSDLRKISGRFGFNWRNDPAKEKCNKVDEEILENFACDFTERDNSAPGRPHIVCTKNDNSAELLIFKTEKICEQEREVQMASGD